jgi:hypothetical protein
MRERWQSGIVCIQRLLGVLQAVALRRDLSSVQERASSEIVNALLAISKIGELRCAEDHSPL